MNNYPHKEFVATARIAGAWYLMLAITGMLGFLLLHSRVYVSDHSITLENLTQQETLARWRLFFEFMIVLSQALAAVWFYKLFNPLRPLVALALAIWGTVNAVVIMISAIAMAGALDVATGTLASNEKLLLVQLYQQVISNAWGVGSLFFGLWLIPMGYIVISAQCMPVWLGRTLILGGIGYLASTFIGYMGVDADWVGLLPIPATVGEFWMIAYLLIFGIRPANQTE